MTGLAVQISDKFVAKKARRVGSKQAWARYVRNRWPGNAVCHAQAEWQLTDGQARGLVYGHASQRTIDDILAHPRGGPVLELQIAAIAWGLELETFVRATLEMERRRLADVRSRAESQERRLVALASRIGVAGALPGSGLERGVHDRRVQVARRSDRAAD